MVIFHWLGLLIPLLLAVATFKAGIRIRRWVLSGNPHYGADVSFAWGRILLRTLATLLYITVLMLAAVLATLPLVLVGSAIFRNI